MGTNKTETRSKGHGRLRQGTSPPKRCQTAAIKDKLAFDDKQFRELQGTKEGWTDLRYKRKPFVPNHSKLEDRHGKRAPYGKKAEAIADYLANEQWAKPERRERAPRPPILAPGAAHWKTTNITVPELQHILGILNINTSPGPDSITT